MSVLRKLFLCVFTVFIGFTLFAFGTNVNGEDNLVPLKNIKGNTMTYPYSNGDVIMIPNTYEKQSVEFRGVWVSFYAGDLEGYSSDEQMMAELTSILDTLEYYHINAIMFHIRTHNDVYYNSDVAPLNDDCKGMDFERWDYLEWFINECHKRGIEFHAWLNPYRIYSTAHTLQETLAKYADYPNNPAHYAENILVGGDGVILDPGRPAVRDYIVDVCMEIIEKYDVDAIHFDDYFYISSVDDSATKKLYNKNNLGTADFRREQVDLFIKQLSDAMYKYNKKTGRAVQLGISPSGMYDNANYVRVEDYKYDASGKLIYPLGSGTRGYAHYGSPLYCDTKKWIDNNWIDYIIPQVYFSFDQSAACYASIVDWWNAVVKNSKCNLYIGQGIYKMTSSTSGYGWYTEPDEWYNQLKYNQKCENVDGVCMYQYKTLLRNIDSKTVQKVLTECWTNDAQLPVIQRYANNNELEVTNEKIYFKNNSVVLTWDKIKNVKNYYVYQYKSNLDLNDPNQIIGIVGNDTDSNTVIFNGKYENKLGNNFAIVPFSKANGLGVQKTISLDKAQELPKEFVIGNFNDHFFTGYGKPNCRCSLKFAGANVNYGTGMDYKVYYCEGRWDESKKQELKIVKLETVYSASFIFSPDGYPAVLRIEGTNDFGTIVSEDIIMTLNYENANDYIAYIITSIENDIYKLMGAR